MTATATKPASRLWLRSFDPRQASVIARWVQNARQLHWLAPSTTLPLTPAKVLAWRRPGGHVFVLTPEATSQPIGYAELNPMRQDADHYWLGHVIIRSDQRRRGIGKAFVGTLLAEAFEQLAANRVSLIVFPDNASALRCYLGAGFTFVGDEYHRFGGTGPKHHLLRLEATPPLRQPRGE